MTRLGSITDPIRADAYPTVGAEAVPFDAWRAGFDDLDEYAQWLALDGDRRLRLALRKGSDRAGQVLDGLGEVLQPESSGPVAPVHCAVAGDQEGAGLLGLADCLIRVAERCRVAHETAPSSVGVDERSVGATVGGPTRRRPSPHPRTPAVFPHSAGGGVPVPHPAAKRPGTGTTPTNP